MYVQPKISWSGVQSITGNYTDVTVRLYYSRTNNGYTTYGTWSGSITINGTTTSGSKYVSLTHNSNTLVLTATTRVYHNANGTKSITISAAGSISGTSVSSTSISSTVTLNTIARATTPTVSSTSVTMGEKVTINLPRASANFTHIVAYSLGDVSAKIAEDATTSAEWTPPVSLARQIPNGTAGTCIIAVGTYNGNTYLGSTQITITLNVPGSVVPTISAVSIGEATTGLAEQFGAYVQNKSALAVNITAQGVYGSTIAKYETTILGVKYTGASFTSQVLTVTGSIDLVVTVTDSRGRTTQRTESVTVLEYYAPKINDMTAWRINTEGNADDEGARIAVAMDFEIAEVGARNARTFALQYRKSSETEFTTFSSGETSWEYSGTQNFTVSPEISTDYAYVIRLMVSDYFQTVTKDFEVPTAFVVIDYRRTGKGMAFGKVSEKDRLEIAMDMDITGALRVYAPTSGQADGAILRMLHSDETLAAFLATSDNGDGLNLHLYQNGEWSGVLKILPDGTLAPGAVPMVDYVVEQGVSGKWEYKKWSSGKLECEGIFSTDSLAVTTAWGSVYAGSWMASTTNKNGRKYPVPFIESPVVRVSPIVGGGNFWLATNQENDTGTHLTHAPAYQCIRATPATLTDPAIHYHVVGRWKERSEEIV